jgi:hypothetical protein
MEQLKNLSKKYDEEIELAYEAYPDSKINDDNDYEKHVDQMNAILGRVGALQQQARIKIQENNEKMQLELDESPYTDTTNEKRDMYDTVKQTLEDNRLTYDKDRIILVLKLIIVAFIFMKGNDIYVRNSNLFIGLTLLFTAIYGVRTYLYT